MNKRKAMQLYVYYHSLMETYLEHPIPMVWRKGYKDKVYGIPYPEIKGYSKPERNARELVNKVPKDLVWHAFVVDLLRILAPVPVWG